MVNTQTATCRRSGGTISRWHQPDRWGVWSAPNPAPADPGPWQAGETVTCSACGATATVTPHATTVRSTGTQYIGILAAH